MMRRCLYVCSATMVLSVLITVAWRSMSRTPPRLRVEMFPHVRVGMTLAEVESLLGGPPGEYGQGGPAFASCESFLAPDGSVQRVWNNDQACFEIYFDGSDRVVTMHKRGLFQRLPSEGVVAQFRRHLGL